MLCYVCQTVLLRVNTKLLLRLSVHTVLLVRTKTCFLFWYKIETKGVTLVTLFLFLFYFFIAPFLNK